jgi:pimeloyl-ACP methyl ester carboxylesterase
MSVGVETRSVTVNGHPHRVWSRGRGRPLGFLAGIGGLPKWTPFLDRLAETREVIAPSLPGFPGAAGHEDLDTIFDWILATHDILAAAGLRGADLMAVSVAGALAAEIAAVWPDFVQRLALVSPFGLFDTREPSADIWAQRPGHLNGLVCAERQTYKDFIEQPEGVDPTEWKVEQMRALEASARYLFPTGNTGLAARLHRIHCPVLLLRGSVDRVMPASYLDRFATGVSGRAMVREIAGAGHLAELDQPDAVASAVREFLE